MEEQQQKFFSITKEKTYITITFFALRMILGYLGKIHVAAKLPFAISMIITAIDFVVSMPMKIALATPALKIMLKNQLATMALFVIMIAYWYLFACVIMHAYNILNKQDNTPKDKHITVHHARAEDEEEKEEDQQTKLA